MKAIYTRTIGVYDEKLGEAMEISKGLAEVRKNIILIMKFIFLFKLVETQEQLEKL